MIQNARNWWSQRSFRERNLITIMLVLLVPVLLWYAVTMPFWNALVASKVRHDNAVEALGRVNAKAFILKKLEQSPPLAQSGPLQSVISQSATEAGFLLTKSEPTANGGMAVSITNAKSAAFFAWITKLEGEGHFIEQASIRPNSDATIAADFVIRAQRR